MKSCPLCGISLLPSFRKDNYSIGQCPSCKLLAVLDDLQGSDLHAQYADNYYTQDAGRYTHVSRGQKMEILSRLKRLQDYSSTASGRALLDIGCGTGAFLEFAQAQGWDVYGVEISPQGRDATANRIGAHKVFDSLGAITPVMAYDTITMWDVIEHLPDPITYLHDVKKLLKPNGILVLSTPNTHALNKHLFGPKWRYFIPPEHLVYFNTENISTMADGLELDTLFMTTYYSDRAFWQMFGLDNQRFYRWWQFIGKSLLLPLHIYAHRTNRGDNLEIILQQNA